MGVTFEQSEYRGYEALVFEIDTRKVILVRPNKEMGHRRLVMKTEYFDAFPDLQIEMLERGYHLTCVENRSRWGTDEDCRTKAEVVRFLHEHFSLYPRVITVGMSCGGFHAVNFASLYPELQSFLYLDAPLLSFLSYPYGMGEIARNEQVIEEMLNLAKQIAAAHKEGEKLGLTADELAFYDALTKPQAIKDFYENEELIAITKELADTLRKNKSIDWQKRDSARAKMRMMIRKLLKQHRYPPEGMEDAVTTVMTQCELWTDNEDMESVSVPREIRGKSTAYGEAKRELPLVAEEQGRYGNN